MAPPSPTTAEGGHNLGQGHGILVAQPAFGAVHRRHRRQGCARQLVGRDEQPRRAVASRLDPQDVRRRRCNFHRRPSFAGGHTGRRLPQPVHGQRQWHCLVGARAMNEVTSMRYLSVRVAVTVGLTTMLWAPVASAQTPDFSGVWLVAPGGGGPGGKVTQWMRQDPPFTPDGLARFNANKPGKGPRQAPPAFGNDPLGDANPPGLLRTLIYPGRSRSFSSLIASSSCSSTGISGERSGPTGAPFPKIRGRTGMATPLVRGPATR